MPAAVVHVAKVLRFNLKKINIRKVVLNGNLFAFWPNNTKKTFESGSVTFKSENQLQDFKSPFQTF